MKGWAKVALARSESPKKPRRFRNSLIGVVAHQDRPLLRLIHNRIHNLSVAATALWLVLFLGVVSECYNRWPGQLYGRFGETRRRVSG